MGLRQHTNILYILKRQFGQTINILTQVKRDLDVETGKVTELEEIYKVKRVVLLPKSTSRSFVQDIAYLAANKNFTQGGIFDDTTRKIIIDTKEMPKGKKLLMTDKILFDDMEYIIKQIVKSEDVGGYHVTIKNVDIMETTL